MMLAEEGTCTEGKSILDVTHQKTFVQYFSSNRKIVEKVNFNSSFN